MVINLPIITKGNEIGIINLNNEKITINKTNYINFSCKRLSECCSTLNIPVTKFDISIIEEQGYELDQILDNFSPFIIPSNTITGYTEKAYLLKRKPFNSECTFLEGNKCSIHNFKPISCKIYPFSLDIMGENQIKVVIHSDSLCNAIFPVDLVNSNNYELLEQILAIIKTELNIRLISM